MLKTMFDGSQTSSNIIEHIQHGDQTSATCCIQQSQCWTMSHQHVASVWPGLKRGSHLCDKHKHKHAYAYFTLISCRFPHDYSYAYAYAYACAYRTSGNHVYTIPDS